MSIISRGGSAGDAGDDAMSKAVTAAVHRSAENWWKCTKDYHSWGTSCSDYYLYYLMTRLFCLALLTSAISRAA